MKSSLAWIPPLAAAAVLMAGIQSFLRRYPRGDRPGAGEVSSLRDTLLPAALLSAASASAVPDFDADTAPVPDPFRMRTAAPSSGWHSAPTVLPARKWRLKGTAGNSVATVLDSLGTKHLLRAGDSLSGMRVLEIHANRVLMRDAGGSFAIELER